MQLNPKELRVGRFVQLSLRTGDKCEGFVFCFSPEADLLVVDENPANDPNERAVRLVKGSCILGVEFVEGVADATFDLKPRVSAAVATKAALAREEKSIKLEEKALMRIGKGVTPQGQRLFDTLSRTLDCRWKGKSIEELKLCVVIDPPYTEASVRGKDTSAVARVQKMVKLIMDS